MENIPKISQAEYIVMDVIWDEGPLSTPEIVARLQDLHDWSPKTIHTLLVRLEKKERLRIRVNPVPMSMPLVWIVKRI